MNDPRPGTRLRTPAVAAGLVLAVTASSLLGSAPAYAVSGHNEQVVLVDGTNAQADAKSMINGTAQVSSADGRYVVFSTAAALVPEDTNDLDDVYLRDTQEDSTTLVSHAGTTIGNDYSVEPTISNDGRYVAFTTWATNLFADKNGSALDVDAVIWATGYRAEFPWLHVPVLHEDGRPRHRRGATEVPGLYFLGLTWQHTRGSALIGWVGGDAEFVAGELDAAGRVTEGV